jgi:hypothetical protein
LNSQDGEEAMSLPFCLQSFGQEHFGAARLNDARRTRCLVDLADRFARHPRGSLPEKCKDSNALRRCYDLMKCPTVTHQSVLQPHIDRTIELVLQQHVVVLLVHDPTELDYSGLTSMAEHRGQIGDGNGKGYICHNSLAVLPAGKAVLGLLSQILHCRPHVPKDETPAQCAARKSRESLLWLKAVRIIDHRFRQACCRKDLPGLPEGLVVVDVSDRASDTFEYMDEEDRLGRKYVNRSKSNRSIRVGHDGKGEEKLLHDYLCTLPLQTEQRKVTVGGRDGQPPREAVVRIAFAAVEVLPPKGHPGNYRKVALKVWAIRVFESNPPDGCEAVEWFLLTNLPVVTKEDAWEKVEWYCCRWVVEEFHKAQKTGCNIEDPQFTKPARLQPMIALLSVVAAMLLNLRDLSRDASLRELPATLFIDEEFVDILSGWRYQEQRPLTVREFFLALARLGGHQNRKCDGDPGWLVLWRGWITLQQMVTGARAARCPKAAACASPSGDAAHAKVSGSDP